MGASVISSNTSLKHSSIATSATFPHGATSTLLTAGPTEIIYLTYINLTAAFGFAVRLSYVSQSVTLYTSTPTVTSFTHNLPSNEVGNTVTAQYILYPGMSFQVVANSASGSGTFKILGYSVLNSP